LAAPFIITISSSKGYNKHLFIPTIGIEPMVNIQNYWNLNVSDYSHIDH
jgi:hypothetical protein